MNVGRGCVGQSSIVLYDKSRIISNTHSPAFRFKINVLFSIIKLHKSFPDLYCKELMNIFLLMFH